MNRSPGDSPRPHRDYLAPLKVALYYGLAAGTWILLSDKLLQLFVRDAAQLTRLEIAKGWLFVLISALLLYFLVRHHLQVIQRREVLLRVSEERFRSIFENAAAGVVILSTEKQILDSNAAFQHLLGFGAAELVGKNLRDLTHPADRDRSERGFRSLLEGQSQAFSDEGRYLARDGRTIWGHTSLACILGREKEAPYCIGLVQDVSDRKRAEEALRASEERFRSVFHTAAAGLVLMRPDGGIFQANPYFCRFIGYPEEELVQMNIAAVTHPDDQERTLEHYRDLSSGREETVHYEKRYLARDGRTVWGHASVACLLGEANLPGYCIGLVQDITDRKRVEEELRESNRELDAFVHTVSHDLRAPLTPIIGYAEFLRQHCRERLDAEIDGFLAEIEGQGRKMLALLEDLLCLAKVGKLECPLAPTATGEVVRESLGDLADRIMESGIEVRVIDPLPPVGVQETLLAQIFQNLIGNALLYAGRTGGPVEVGGDRRHDRVRFFVRDHGPGVPPEEREGIFDLFQRGSTGRHLKGTGVGLAIVQKIARLYQGRVWVEETPGGGATFWAELIDECTSLPAGGAEAHRGD